MNPVPTLSDGHVTLRAHTEDDLARVVEQSTDPASVRWTRVPVPYRLDDAKRFVRHAMPGGWESDQEWGFAVEYAGEYAGTVSLRDHGERRAEIAFGAHPAVRGVGVEGSGVMERALQLLLGWGFAPVADGGRGLGTVVWYAHVGNWASRRLAWKVGFSHDGVLRGWIDHRGELLDVWAGTLRAGEALIPRHEWLPVTRITGSHVVLRRHRDDDAVRVQEACSDERTSYWLGQLPAPYTLEDAERFLLGREEGMASGNELHWMIADPATDAALGVVSLMHLQDRTAEIGFWSHPDARGRGVMTEAVRLAVRHAFVDREDGGLGLRRLTLLAAVDNTASRHVAEANGFVPTGVAHGATRCRDGHHDLAGYDLLVGDWVAAVRPGS